MMTVKKLLKKISLNNISGSAIVVELNPETLTVVEVANRNNGAELVRFAVRTLPPDGINATWLKAIWHQEHFSHHRIIYCLPTVFVKYKSLLMPLLPPEQLEEAVKFEMENGNESHLSEIIKIIDWQKQDQMIVVNIALIERELLTKELHLFRQAGIEVDWSGLRYQGLLNFINFNVDFFEESSDGAVYLDFCGQQTEFGIIKDEVMVFRQDFLDDQDENALPDFLEEVRLSIASYQAESKSKLPPKMGVFGKTDAVAKIGPAITDELKMRLYITEKTKLTGVITHKYTSGLAPLIGLALDKIGVLRPDVLRIYTPEQDNARTNRERLIIAIGIGFVLAFLLSGILLGMQANLTKDGQTNEWLYHKAALLAKLRRSEQQTVHNAMKIKQIDDWLSRQNQELEFLLLLKNNLPDGTQITDLTIEDGIVKDLSGVTPSVSFLLNKMKTISGLQNLKIKGTISTSLEGEIFQLEGTVSGKEPTK
jgi:hypothetical protein